MTVGVNYGHFRKLHPTQSVGSWFPAGRWYFHNDGWPGSLPKPGRLILVQLTVQQEPDGVADLKVM